MQSVREILKEELNKCGVNLIQESQLSSQEQSVINNILGNNGGLQEAVDFNNVLQKVSTYAKQGLITAGILMSLMASHAFSQEQKQQIKNVYAQASSKRQSVPNVNTPSQPTQIANPDSVGGGESPNFTKTNDPNVVMGKYGVPITMADYQRFIKDPKGFKFNDFYAYADWIGGWAHPEKPIPANKLSGQQGKPQQGLSDKAQGNSSNYYPANSQQTGKAIPTQHSNYYK